MDNIYILIFTVIQLQLYAFSPQDNIFFKKLFLSTYFGDGDINIYLYISSHFSQLSYVVEIILHLISLLIYQILSECLPCTWQCGESSKYKSKQKHTQSLTGAFSPVKANRWRKLRHTEFKSQCVFWMSVTAVATVISIISALFQEPSEF